MRLIDADAMLERNINNIYNTTDLKGMLDNEPTAYDIGNVLNQLDEAYNNMRLGDYHNIVKQCGRR